MPDLPGGTLNFPVSKLYLKRVISLLMSQVLIVFVGLKDLNQEHQFPFWCAETSHRILGWEKCQLWQVCWLPSSPISFIEENVVEMYSSTDAFIWCEHSMKGCPTCCMKQKNGSFVSSGCFCSALELSGRFHWWRKLLCSEEFCNNCKKTLHLNTYLHQTSGSTSPGRVCIQPEPQLVLCSVQHNCSNLPQMLSFCLCFQQWR